MSSSVARLPPRPVITSPTARQSIPLTVPAASGATGRTTGAAARCVAGALDEVGRPAELGDHAREALRRRAGVQRLLRGGARGVLVGLQAALDEQRGGERERHLVQPRLARGAREVVDRLAHLERVAGARAEHLVHVGQQRDGRQPGAARDLDERAGELLGRPRARP